MDLLGSSTLTITIGVSNLISSLCLVHITIEKEMQTKARLDHIGNTLSATVLNTVTILRFIPHFQIIVTTETGALLNLKYK